MKRFSFLQVALMIALMVVAASCTVTRGYDDEYYENDRRRNAYGNQVIVVERDPYTGRYYEVDRYGNYLGATQYGAYDRYYSNRYYDNRYYGNGYRNNVPSSNNSQQTEKAREESQKKVNEARDVIRGKRN